MTLVVVARPLDLPQAQVAASALRSAGLHPVLLDEQLNSSIWTMTFAFGGCRVAVPEDELKDAVAILEQPPEPPAPEGRIDRIGWGWRAAAGLASVGLLTPYAGWFVLGARQRSRNVAETAIGFGLVTLSIPLIMAALAEMVWVLTELLAPNGLR
jgi:hypothetical protein